MDRTGDQCPCRIIVDTSRLFRWHSGSRNASRRSVAPRVRPTLVSRAHLRVTNTTTTSLIRRKSTITHRLRTSIARRHMCHRGRRTSRTVGLSRTFRTDDPRTQVVACPASYRNSWSAALFASLSHFHISSLVHHSNQTLYSVLAPSLVHYFCLFSSMQRCNN